MKRATLFILSCIVMLCMYSVPTKANYAAGGELLYEWTSGTTYRFYFKLYRDCGGVTEPATLPLCFSNSCNSTSFTATMTKYPMTVPPYKFQCPQLITKCDNPSATLPGYQEIWYYADATLPSQCNSWRIFTYLATRNTSNNIANSSSTNMYIEVLFNNTGTFEGNSSAYYSNKAYITTCQGSPFFFNNGAVDPNGDSLVTEVIQPLTSITSCSGTPSAASFVAASPALNIPTNPFQTNNGFTINAQTGLITFTPSQTGVSALAIRTKEYRNGVLVSSLMREIPVNVYSCGIPTTPTLTLGGNPVNGMYSTCSGQSVSFSFNGTSTDPSAILYVSNSSIPGAAVNYTNQGTNSVTGNFNWTPPVNASGLYNLLVTIYDSTCNLPGIVYSYTSTIPIMVWNKVNAGADTSLCVGATADLHVNGPGQLTWNILSGDMNSLSCSTCYTPTVSPNVSSQYQVTVNGLPAGCPPKMDTVNVNVIPYNKPSVNVSVSPGANAWPGLNITFTATTAYCDTPHYQWRINGADVPGATNAVFNTTTLANGDMVTCLLHCTDTCIIDTPSNAITMNIATNINDVSASGTKLYPNPNNGSFTLTVPCAGDALDLEIINTLGQVVYQQQRFSTGSKKTLEIETGSLPDGHYILKLADDGKTDVLRFSVQH